MTWKCVRTLAVGLVAVVALAGVGYAQSGEVYSLNIVGFQKVTAHSQNLSMVSTPFVRSPATIDDVVGSQLHSGKSEIAADNILFWNAVSSRYDRYWLKTADLKWYTAGATPVLATNAFIYPSDGFWIQNRSNTITAVFSGDVVDDGAATNSMIEGLNMVSYPFSANRDLNSTSLTNGLSGKSEIAADNVIVWDPTSLSYQRYWLKSTDKKWYTAGATPIIATVDLASGSAFWYQRRTNIVFSWVETRPYSL